MRWLHAGVAALLATAMAASADTISPGPDAVTVTIYPNDSMAMADLVRPDASDATNSGLAFITEMREIDLPAGPAEIRLRGVAATMVPQSAAIDGLPAGVLERNFDYDLLSPGSLLAKSIGQTVRLVRTDPKTGRTTVTPAIVRSGPDGAMLEVAGKLEALHCSALPERLIFDRTPDGLTETPTLAVRTNAPAAGHYRIKLTYLATALDWAADYVAHINPDGHTLDLTGWLTLANFGATSFRQAQIYAVAGQINTEDVDYPLVLGAQPSATHCWPTDIHWWGHPPALVSRQVNAFRDLQFHDTETVVITGSRIPDPLALGDYKIYTLPEATDMPARQTKQVQFLDLHDVPFRRVFTYVFDPNGYADTDDFEKSDWGDPASLYLVLKNEAGAGLGKALPAGHIAVTETGPGGGALYVAKSQLWNVPVGLPLQIRTMRFVEVGVKGHVVEVTRTGTAPNQVVRRVIELEIVNSRAEGIDFDLRMADYGSQVRIVSETRRHSNDEFGTHWALHLAAGESLPIRIALEMPN